MTQHNQDSQESLEKKKANKPKDILNEHDQHDDTSINIERNDQ